ncbi:MAG TPA: hypothetical protein VHC73_11395 [Vitreimonas sp.]|jgi:hypothetical protein|nr:hypothetical protein [Vitreimonas sp.]
MKKDRGYLVPDMPWSSVFMVLAVCIWLGGPFLLAAIWGVPRVPNPATGQIHPIHNHVTMYVSDQYLEASTC